MCLPFCTFVLLLLALVTSTPLQLTKESLAPVLHRSQDGGVSCSPELKSSQTLEVCQTQAKEHGGCRQASSSMPPFEEPSCDNVHSSSQDVLQAESGEPHKTNFDYCSRPSKTSLHHPGAFAPLQQNHGVLSESAIPTLDVSDTTVSNGPLDDSSGSGGCQYSTADRRRGSDGDAATAGRQKSSEDYQLSSTKAYPPNVTQKALQTEMEQNAGLLHKESDSLRLQTPFQTGPEGGTMSGATGSSIERKKRLAERLVSLPQGERTHIDAGRGIIKNDPGSPTEQRRFLLEKTVANYNDLSSGLSTTGYGVLRIINSFVVTQALTISRSVTIRSDTTLCAGGRCTISGNVSWSSGLSGLTKVMLSCRLYL